MDTIKLELKRLYISKAEQKHPGLAAWTVIA